MLPDLPTYDPTDWYWIVASDETKLYSSKAGDYVQPSNAAYVAWQANGGIPTRIGSAADLGEVLAQYSLRPANAAVLDSYQDRQSRELTIQVVAKVLLWCVNEIRTLKGQPTVNAGQFRAFLKGLM